MAWHVYQRKTLVSRAQSPYTLHSDTRVSLSFALRRDVVGAIRFTFYKPSMGIHLSRAQVKRCH